MDQTVINWLLAAGGALVGAILKVIWDSVKDLQKADTALVARVGEIEVLVAGKYVLKEEFDKTLDRTIAALFAKLDKIEIKLDRKVDKS